MWCLEQTTVVAELLQKMINPLQKNCLLIIDEIKIRPSIVYSGGILCGKAANDRNECQFTEMSVSRHQKRWHVSICKVIYIDFKHLLFYLDCMIASLLLFYFRKMMRLCLIIQCCSSLQDYGWGWSYGSLVEFSEELYFWRNIKVFINAWYLMGWLDCFQYINSSLIIISDKQWKSFPIIRIFAQVLSVQDDDDGENTCKFRNNI